MRADLTSSYRGRAVVLSGDQRLAETCRQVNLEAVRVSSAYEAAAEILAAPTFAMIIDLRLLPVGHTPLLEVARQMGLEMFAVGAVDATLTAEELNGVQMVSHDDLPQMIRQSLLAQFPQAAESAPAAPAEQPASEALAPDFAPAPAKNKQAPVAIQPATPARVQPSQGVFVSDTADEASRTVAQTKADSSDNEPLLTSEELDALLRNEP